MSLGWVNLKRYCSSALLAWLLLPQAAAAWTEHNVALPSNPAPLFGTLAMPDGAGAVTGVLMLAGSGPTDRDGNQPGLYNDSLKLLADGLADCGIASLRVDTRGIAASHAAGEIEEDLHFNDYVTDTVRWLGLLGGQPRIDRLTLLGHSEGGLFATLAAQRVPVARLVLLEAAGRPAGEVIRWQLQSDALAPVLRREADRDITLLEHGQTIDDVPPALGMLFRGSVQPYLIDWFRYDPAAELARTAAPALVVQGGTDVQVTATDAHRLAQSRAGVTLAQFPAMNHVLRAAPSDWASNLATYARPDLPLMPGLVDRVCAFLRP